MRHRFVAAALVGGFAFACGSDPVNSGSNAAAGGGAGTAGYGGTAGRAVVAGTGGTGNETGNAGESAGGGAGAPEPVTCDEPSYADPSLMATAVGQVNVTVHDTDGAPVVKKPVMVCGTNLCSDIEQTEADGTASVPAIASGMIKPVLKFGDGLAYAELAILLDDPKAGGTFSNLTLPALPAQGAPMLAGTDATSNGVTLALAENATVTGIDTISYPTPDSQALRAAELPADSFPKGLDHGAGLELVFTLAPLGAVICPAARLRLPNSAGWDPGTAVEFLVQGLQIGDEPFAPYGEWQSVATGIVDDSGATLVTKTGGLPIVANVGVRRL